MKLACDLLLVHVFIFVCISDLFLSYAVYPRAGPTGRAV